MPDTDAERRISIRRDLAGRPKLCPVCASLLEATSPLSPWLTPETYFCARCGYTGPLAMEAEQEESKQGLVGD